MKIEVVDKANPQLIRPGTVLKCKDYQLLIIYDGFEIFYSHWIDDDSVDIHPINWCDKTNHPSKLTLLYKFCCREFIIFISVEHPAGYGQQNGLCNILGCRGIGNALNRNKYFHDCINDCPYMKQNWVEFHDQQPIRVLTNEIQLVSSNNKKPQNTALNKIPLKPKLARSRVGSKRSKELSDDAHIDYSKIFQKKTQVKRSSASAANSEQDEPKFKRKKLPNYVPTTTIRIDTSKDHLAEYGPQLRYAQKLW